MFKQMLNSLQGAVRAQGPQERSPLFETLLRKAESIGPEPLPEVTQAGVPPPGGGFSGTSNLWRMLSRQGLPSMMSTTQKYLPMTPVGEAGTQPVVGSLGSGLYKNLMQKFGGKGRM